MMTDYLANVRSSEILSRMRDDRVGKHCSPLKVFTPYELASPVKTVYGDRFIPLRTSERSAEYINSSPEKSVPFAADKMSKSVPAKRGYSKIHAYKALLSEQLLERSPERKVKRTLFASSPRVLQFSAEKITKNSENLDPSCSSSSITALTMSTEAKKLFSPVQQHSPKIPVSPVRILDAPSLENDFYLNILDYSSKNVISLVLGDSVYLWHEGKSTPVYTCQYDDYVPTSLGFNQSGDLLCMGLRNGGIQLHNVDVAKKAPMMPEKIHRSRIGVLTWKDNCVFTGCKTGPVYCKDVRMGVGKIARKFEQHKQEVCGLKNYHDGNFLASGCNDNKVLIWDIGSGKVVHTFEHKAAVKAIDWNPNRPGTLSTGGGTSDRTLYHWNTVTGQMISKCDVGSQITGVFWCHHSNYYVTTQGYSSNDVILWDGETNEKLAVLEGHNARVVYAAMAPDSSMLITAAGEPCSTLRFWNVFPKKKAARRHSSSCLSLFERL